MVSSEEDTSPIIDFTSVDFGCHSKTIVFDSSGWILSIISFSASTAPVSESFRATLYLSWDSVPLFLTVRL